MSLCDALALGTRRSGTYDRKVCGLSTGVSYSHTKVYGMFRRRGFEMLDKCSMDRIVSN